MDQSDLPQCVGSSNVPPSYQPPMAVEETDEDDDAFVVLQSRSTMGSQPSDEGGWHHSISQQAPEPNSWQDDSPLDPSLQGGRLWNLACEEAQRRANHAQTDQINPPTASQPLVSDHKQRKGPGSQLAETFMARTRSRADPDALVMNRPTAYEVPPTSMVIVDKQDEEFLIDTGLAHRRVHVVQLLLIGIVGVLLGWLGNFFVGFSCHFVSTTIRVGQYGDSFSLHFGLWKFTPVDSALDGYKYCYPYTGVYVTDAPIFTRLAHLLVFAAGTYSLIVLWWYLILGSAHPTAWKWAVRMGIVAGVCQLLTLLFFVERLCRLHTCSAGPASVWTMIPAVAWFVLAWELHYNSAVVNESKWKNNASSVVANLEMADLAVASQEYLERCSSGRLRDGYHPPALES